MFDFFYVVSMGVAWTFAAFLFLMVHLGFSGISYKAAKTSVICITHELNSVLPWTATLAIVWWALVILFSFLFYGFNSFFLWSAMYSEYFPELMQYPYDPGLLVYLSSYAVILATLKMGRFGIGLMMSIIFPALMPLLQLIGV